jgi:hypothetical protein
MKIWNYIFIIVTMLLFYQFMGWTGINNPIADFSGINMTTMDNHIEIAGFSMSSSYFKDYLFGVFFLTLIGSGIAIGLFATGQGDIAIRAGFAPAIFVGFISSLYIPITKGLEVGIDSWAMGILAIVFIPFSIGFLIALVDWVLGGAD